MRKPKKKRDYKAEYARRISKGTQLGYSRAQAAGHPRKGELNIRTARTLVDTSGPSVKTALLRRIYDQLEGDDRAKAIELYKLAARDFWINPATNKREAFRRRINKNEKPRPMDLLLLMLSDVEQAEFGLDVSGPTQELLDQLRGGKWKREVPNRYLPEILIEQLSDES